MCIRDRDVVVPHRIDDGYGINERLIQQAYDQGVDTIVTCDNGIAAIKQIEYAKELGMTVVVTDHHEVVFEENNGKKEYILPMADAIVNHKQKDCQYPFKELCGAMVAFQFMRALFENMHVSERFILKLLPYGAMATVCDVVELKGENRIIVKEGLEALKINKDIGINACLLYTSILQFCTAAKSGYTPTKAELKNKKYIKVDKSYYQVWLTGDTVASAEGQATTNDKGVNENIVSLQFNSEGTKAFGEMTSSHVGEQSFIIYDDEVLSAPKIQAAITGGQAQITGDFTLKEAQTLATNIGIGSLEVQLDELSHSVQSANLGSDALSKSIQAGIVCFIIIILFLLFVYRIPGLAAGLALISYIELMLLAPVAYTHLDVYKRQQEEWSLQLPVL